MRLTYLYRLFNDTKTENKSSMDGQILIASYLNTIKNIKQKGYKNDKENVYEKCKKKISQRGKRIF
jgi:hypothetical protein